MVRLTKTFSTLRSSEGAKNDMYFPSGDSFGLAYLGLPKRTSLGISRSSEVAVAVDESSLVASMVVKLDGVVDAPPLSQTMPRPPESATEPKPSRGETVTRPRIDNRASRNDATMVINGTASSKLESGTVAYCFVPL